MDNINVVDYLRNQKKAISEELARIKQLSDDDPDKKKNFDDIFFKTEEIKKYVHRHKPTMIAYDIRTCNDLIKELESEVNKQKSSLNGQKSFKFSFGIKTNPSKTKHMDEVDSKPKSTTETNISKLPNLDYCCVYRNIIKQKLSIDSNESEGKDILIESLDSCHVEIKGVPTSVRLINLKNCSIYTGPISSSAFIEKCEKCTLKIIAQQVRIHETKECDIYLHVTSRTIIEDSMKLRFGCYDWTYDCLDEHFRKSAMNPTVNNWKEIDDFNSVLVSSNWEYIDNK